MPVLNRTRRRNLRENISALIQAVDLPRGVIAYRAKMDPYKLMHLLEPSYAVDSLVLDFNELRRICDAFSIYPYSPLYGFNPDTFRARYITPRAAMFKFIRETILSTNQARMSRPADAPNSPDPSDPPDPSDHSDLPASPPAPTPYPLPLSLDPLPAPPEPAQDYDALDAVNKLRHLVSLILNPLLEPCDLHSIAGRISKSLRSAYPAQSTPST